MPERFTAIASIEMFEAVGQRWWPVFFSRVKSLLEPGQAAALQVITIDEVHFDAYSRNPDFTQRYIFPGGMLPSPSRFREAAEKAGLAVAEQRFFGHDYARTLQQWAKQFECVLPQVKALGFDDRFVRMWRYYLSYCRAGFDSGNIDVMQVRLESARPRDYAFPTCGACGGCTMRNGTVRKGCPSIDTWTVYRPHVWNRTPGSDSTNCAPLGEAASALNARISPWNGGRTSQPSGPTRCTSTRCSGGAAGVHRHAEREGHRGMDGGHVGGGDAVEDAGDDELAVTGHRRVVSDHGEIDLHAPPLVTDCRCHLVSVGHRNANAPRPRPGPQRECRGGPRWIRTTDLTVISRAL